MKDLRWMSNIGVLKDQEHIKFSEKQRLEETVARQKYFLHLVPVFDPYCFKRALNFHLPSRCSN